MRQSSWPLREAMLEHPGNCYLRPSKGTLNCCFLSLLIFNRRDFETIGSAWGIAVVTQQEALRQMRRKDEEK